MQLAQSHQGNNIAGAQPLRAPAPVYLFILKLLLLISVMLSSGCVSWSASQNDVQNSYQPYPYPLEQGLKNRVADALRIANLRIEQLNLSGGGDCVPARIYRMQQLAHRIQQEHLSGLNQDALHDLRVLDQQINDTEYGLRYLQTRTTCMDSQPDRQLTAMQPLLDELSRFSFATDQAKLPDEMITPLLNLSHWLKNHPVYRVELIGHTDAVGSESYNAQLALQRAEAVTTFLKQQGIADHQILTDAQGEHNPIATNALAQNRAQNRRVRFNLRLLLERSSRSQQVKHWPSVTELWGDR
ncbi:OmpA family protein [Oceanospirillum multiglobuliferum]|uniref:OmpA-like domain-containing protein n=1 Tax=Oceanospirillum multiglobuliferum TaxID=64969 RepID=A0A1T4RXH9_9GAMM|nr:OmpA family protein [Oceanospirillum multiglobuliferum]OPX54596.1 hypothetical protein BTE48_13530 [Oceanospirillum multiglobuliferum]SKA20672.1 OmpA family protein [Oceanospirillum multiglobuliferum]